MPSRTSQNRCRAGGMRCILTRTPDSHTRLRLANNLCAMHSTVRPPGSSPRAHLASPFTGTTRAPRRFGYSYHRNTRAPSPNSRPTHRSVTISDYDDLCGAHDLCNSSCMPGLYASPDAHLLRRTREVDCTDAVMITVMTRIVAPPESSWTDSVWSNLARGIDGRGRHPCRSQEQASVNGHAGLQNKTSIIQN
jgi:hypothetical protein